MINCYSNGTERMKSDEYIKQHYSKINNIYNKKAQIMYFFSFYYNPLS